MARTDNGDAPWVAPHNRTLLAVTDESLVAQWASSRAEIHAGLINVLEEHGLDWTIFVPITVRAAARFTWDDDAHLVLSALGPNRHDMLRHQSRDTVVLLVGVRSGTCSWETGMAAAAACRAVLAALVPEHEMHVYVAELAILRSQAGGDDDDDHDDDDHADDDELQNDQVTNLPLPAFASLRPNLDDSAAFAFSSSPPPAPSSSSLPPPPSSPPAAASSSTLRAIPRLFQIFDATYGAVEDRSYAHAGIAPMHFVNDPLMPLLPYPGQAIEQTAASTRTTTRRRGTMGCYVRLYNPDGSPQGGIYGLTSRHVAVGDRVDFDKPVLAHAPAPAPASASASFSPTPDLVVSWGSHVRIHDLCSRYDSIARAIKNELPVLMRRIEKRGFPEDLLEQLQLAETCLRDYIPCIVEQMKRETAASEANDDDDDSQASIGRRIGHVAYSGQHGHNQDNGWSDWALVALDDDDSNNNDNDVDGALSSGLAGLSLAASGPFPSTSLSPSSSVTRPAFCTNSVYFGPSLTVPTTTMQLDADNEDAWNRLRDQVDSAGFLHIKKPSAKPFSWHELNSRTHTSAQYVLKQGSVTRLTMGLLSPIEAVIRTPLEDRDVVAWCWPVLGTPNLPTEGENNPPFSRPGDSGSLVFDLQGNAVAMLDAGVAADRPPRRIFVHHPGVPEAEEGSRSASPPSPVPAPLPPSTPLPPQTPVPAPFVPWTTHQTQQGQIGGNNNKNNQDNRRCDITLLTALDSVFKDIFLQTGLTAQFYYPSRTDSIDKGKIRETK